MVRLTHLHLLSLTCVGVGAADAAPTVPANARRKIGGACRRRGIAIR